MDALLQRWRQRSNTFSKARNRYSIPSSADVVIPIKFIRASVVLQAPELALHACRHERGSKSTIIAGGMLPTMSLSAASSLCYLAADTFALGLDLHPIRRPEVP